MRTHPHPSNNTRFVLMAMVAGLLFLCGLSLHLLNATLFPSSSEPASGTLPTFTENAPSPQPESTQWQSITLEEGDTLDQIAVYFGISAATLQEILQNPIAAHALAHLRPGSNMSLLFSKDHTLIGLRYNGFHSNLELTYQQSQWSVAVAPKPLYQRLPKAALKVYLAANSAQAKELKVLTQSGLHRMQQTIALTATYPLQVNMTFMPISVQKLWRGQLPPILPLEQMDVATAIRSLQATQAIIMLVAKDFINATEQRVQQVRLSPVVANPMDLTGVIHHLQAIQQLIRLTVNPLYLSWDFIHAEMQKLGYWQSPAVLLGKPTVLTLVNYYRQAFQQIFILAAENPLLLNRDLIQLHSIDIQPTDSLTHLVTYFGINNPIRLRKATITAASVIPASNTPSLPIPQPQKFLFASSDQTKINPHLYLQLQTIFKGVVHVNPKLYQAERVNMVYDGAGNILVATVTQHHQTFEAVRYTDSHGFTGYYTPTGQALFKSFFLMAPVKYTRISDHFTTHRWHPILHIMRPHYGIDYAAPTGTPIRAVSSGRVSFSGWGNGYGNTVIIRHNNHYQSLYAHMSHIGYSIKPGQWVNQGQIIGYVGRTGLATGPHLHFGLYQYGKAVNPENVLPKVNPPAAVAESDLPDFLAKTNQLLTQLASAPNHGKKV